jgi:hypothetical protein
MGAAMPSATAELPKPVRARFAPGSLDLPRHEVRRVTAHRVRVSSLSPSSKVRLNPEIDPLPLR